jgi:hypothetical protein
MANEDKQVRKIARCIQTLLEAEGHKVTSTKVMGLIQDKDLTNIPALKDEVIGAINDMRSTEEAQKTVAKPDRRKQIETSYSQGRYTKEQRQKLKDELLATCSGDEPAEATETPAEEETAMADDANAELAAGLLGSGAGYDF